MLNIFIYGFWHFYSTYSICLTIPQKTQLFSTEVLPLDLAFDSPRSSSRSVHPSFFVPPPSLSPSLLSQLESFLLHAPSSSPSPPCLFLPAPASGVGGKWWRPSCSLWAQLFLSCLPLRTRLHILPGWVPAGAAAFASLCVGSSHWSLRPPPETENHLASGCRHTYGEKRWKKSQDRQDHEIPNVFNKVPTLSHFPFASQYSGFRCDVYYNKIQHSVRQIEQCFA